MLKSYLKRKAILYFKKVIELHMSKETKSNSGIFIQIFIFGGVFFLAVFLICQYDAIGEPNILTLLFILYGISLYMYFQIVQFLENVFWNFFHSLFYKKYYKKYGQVGHRELLEVIEKELYVKDFEDEKNQLEKVVFQPKVEHKKRTVKKI